MYPLTSANMSGEIIGAFGFSKGLGVFTPTWFFAVLFDVLILFRGIRCNSLGRYPFFFTNIFCSLVGDIVLATVRGEAPGHYSEFYWGVQFATLLAACGVVLEIFNHVLSGYPGAEKFARTVSIAVFAIVCSFSLLYPSFSQDPTMASSVIEFERDARTVQAIFLCAILLIIFYYHIRLGKNVAGMTIGYGLYILISLVSLAVRAYAGHAFDTAWRSVQPVAFNACLFIWTYSLWTYAPAPSPLPNARIGSDYETLVSKTKVALGSMRSYLGRSIRS